MKDSRAAIQMNIERIILSEIELPLKHPFETSFGVTTGRRVIIIVIHWRNCDTDIWIILF